MDMLIGDMTTYIQSIDSIKGSVSIILMSASSLVQKSYYVKLLLDFLKNADRIKTEKNAIENTENIINSIETIEFKNVSYKYKNCQEYALKNLTFSIHSGEVIDAP